MRLGSKVKNVFHKYAFALIDTDLSYNTRLHILYNIIKNDLDWIEIILKELGVTDPIEIKIEIFLMLDSIFKNFDPKRSSIVNYLEVMLPYEIPKFKKRLTETDILIPEILYEIPYYEIQEEYYWSIPGVIFENKYLKSFTNAEKYLIYKILATDDDKLSSRKLSKEIKISRKNLITRLSIIKDKLQEVYNGKKK